MKKYLKSFMLLVFFALIFPGFGQAFRVEWPDTGQTKSYTDTFGEDSDYNINPQSYTKLGSGGAELSDTATPAQGWIMTSDNVTELIWEVKKDDGSIHDKDNIYTWANTTGFITALNNSNYGGYSDWRMPTIQELSTIVNSDRYDPAINTIFFPNTKLSNYWSSTNSAWSSGVAWFVHFGNNHLSPVNITAQSDNLYVRAVRGGNNTQTFFINCGDGTIIDTSTSLMWQQATQTARSWESAITYCESLSLAGHDDWRLPNRNELQSLVNYEMYSPSTYTSFFPDTQSSNYWSSSSVTSNSDSAWSLYFGMGNYNENKKSQNIYVRAVRGGQSEPSISYLEISGSTSVNENSGAPYTCKAYYSDGTNTTITPTWSENSNYATISSSGYLTTDSVSSNQSCTITATYGGKTDTCTVIIIDVGAQEIMLDRFEDSTYGTIHGASYTNNGYEGKGMLFDEAGDSVSYNSSYFPSEGTFEAYVCINGDNPNWSNDIIFDSNARAGYNNKTHIALYITSDRSLRFQFWGPTSSFNTIDSNTSLELSKWYSVGASWGSEGIFLYINGQLEASDLSATDSWDSETVYLGDCPDDDWAGSNYYNSLFGIIDSVRTSGTQNDITYINSSGLQEKIAANHTHTIGLQNDGTVLAVGDNFYGQCNVESWTDIKQVAAGAFHTVGLKNNDTVIAVGNNSYGPCNLESWTNIKQVTAGWYYTIGLKSDSTVVAVGDNSYGQCNVESWTDITQISASYHHTSGLKNDGTVVAVGDNQYGERNVGSWTNIRQVAAGAYHTVGLKNDDTIVVVGDNSYGQCDIDSWINIKQIAAGVFHTVGLKDDGTVAAVGRNDYGGCNVNSWTDIIQITAGYRYTIGLKNDGTIVATGINDDGQCDTDTWNLLGNEISYIQISGLTSVDENSGAAYTCKAYYSSGANATITPTWSENSNYAAINSSGYLTTGSVSTNQSCTITASYGGKTDTHNVIIENTAATLSYIQISGPTSVDENSGAAYTCRAYYSNGTNSAITPTWNENSNYATISSSGYLTTGSVSTNQSCTITATYGGKTDTHNVIIENIAATLSYIQISGPTSINENSGAAYTCRAYYSNGTNAAITPTWSENSNYATISSSGYLTTGSVSTNQSCTITGTYGGRTDTHNVMIINAGTPSISSAMPWISFLLLNDSNQPDPGDTKFPIANITIDGSIADWNAVDFIVNDEVGEGFNAAADIEYTKFAFSPDLQYFYILLKVTGNISSTYTYRFLLDTDQNCVVDNEIGNFSIDIKYTQADGWTTYSQEFLPNDQWRVVTDNGVVAVNGSYVEARVNAAAFNLPDTTMFIGGFSLIVPEGDCPPEDWPCGTDLDWWIEPGTGCN